jgi:hypothetical protein
MIKVTMEMNEEQAWIVVAALEEWFRLRMGQSWNLPEGLAFLDYQKGEDKESFDRRIKTRDSIDAVIKAMFVIAFPPYGYPTYRNPAVDTASDIWSVLKHTLNGRPEDIYRIGKITPPKVIVERGEEE